MRAALFTFVGGAFFLHWLVVDPSYDVSESQSEWGYVLAFSAALLALAVALPVYARLVAGGPVVLRVSLVSAAGAGLSGLANVLEDGLQMGWAFFAFILGSAFTLLGLLALTVVMALARPGWHRLLALVPAGTLAAIVLYVIAGGVLMLVTWVAAAAVALAPPARNVRHTT